ncbi:hypothetical protein JCM8547_005819 [Rhodosporidiobolus lusitaniae]
MLAENCGATYPSTIHTFPKIRVRLCSDCCGGDGFVWDGLLECFNPPLHPHVRECVQSGGGSPVPSVGIARSNLALKTYEKEDNDIRAENSRLAKTTKSRRWAEPKEPNKVEHVVEERKQIVKNEIKRSAERRRRGGTGLKSLAYENRRREELEAREQAVRAELHASSDWTDEQIAYHEDEGPFFWYHDCCDRVTKILPSEDPEAWLAWYDEIQKNLDEMEDRRLAQPGQDARLAILQERIYDVLKARASRRALGHPS